MKNILIPLFAAAILSSCASVSPLNRHRSPLQRSTETAVQTTIRKPAETIQINELRVLLQSGKQGLKVSAKGGLRLIHRGEGSTVAILKSGEQGRLIAKDERLYYKDKLLNAPALQLHPIDKASPILVDGKEYRGDLIIRASNSKLILINEVSLDEYLYGVLSSEVPPDWPWAALRAQAVAARTYALFRMKSTQSKHFDLDDSTSSQVYSGISREHPRTSQAVNETRGIVLSYQNQIAETFFHSNCGGHTTGTRSVWGKDIPYLRGIRDSHCRREKHADWEVSISKTEAQRRLSSASKLKGSLISLHPYDRDESERWEMVRIEGSGGDVKVKSSSFRLALGADILRSTHFSLIPRGDEYIFKGRGWGHGIGLCQEGAKVKAGKGWDYRKILRNYYPGTRLVTFEDF